MLRSPASPVPVDLSALAALIRSDVAAAERQIADALARDPENVALLEAKVLALLRRFDMPAVVRATESALARRPTANLHFWRGGALLHLGDNAGALKALQAAAALHPSAACLDVLGRCLHRLGRLEEAVRVLDRAMREPEANDTPIFSSQRGLIYALRDLGRWQEADQLARDLMARFRARPLRVASMMLHCDIVHPYHRWSPFLDKAGLARALTTWHERHPAEAVSWPESFLLLPKTGTLPGGDLVSEDANSGDRDANSGDRDGDRPAPAAIPTIARLLSGFMPTGRGVFWRSSRSTCRAARAST